MSCDDCKYSRQTDYYDILGCVKYLDKLKQRKIIEILDLYNLDFVQYGIVDLSEKQDNTQRTDGVIVFERGYECKWWEHK